MAIVIVIAVLVVLIPLGFLISCIIRKVKERKEKELEEHRQMQLPDHSSITH